MAPQSIYIHTETGLVRRNLSGMSVPVLVGMHRASLGISVAFVTSGVVAALPAETELRLVAKLKGSHVADPLLMDLAAEVSGEGTATRYLFTAVCDSVQLRSAMGEAEALDVRCQVEWSLPGDTEPRLSLPFDLHIVQAYSRGEDDEIPDPVQAAWSAGLDARAVRHDVVQSLSAEHRATALANLGIVVTNDELRILCPDGVTRRALLSDLEPEV